MSVMRGISAGMILVMAGSACSSSKKVENPDEPVVEASNAEAATDEVPPTAAADPAAPPADQSAPPPQNAAEADISDKQVSAQEQQAQAAAPEALPPATDQKIKYQVQSGDTLMKIAFENYGDLYQWKKIYEENQSKIQNPNVLTVGTVLEFERPAQPFTLEQNGEKYLIKFGDTLGKISADVYGTMQKWRVLWENNRPLIKDPNKIFAGFYLYYVKDAQTQTLTQASDPVAPEVAAPAMTPPAQTVAAAAEDTSRAPTSAAPEAAPAESQTAK